MRPRGPWLSTWLRLRRDSWSIVAIGALAGILFFALFGGAIVTRIVGHNGTRPFPYATSAALKPVGPWTRVPATDEVNLNQFGQVLAPSGSARALLVLGADGPLGRDELIRVLDGARTSLEIALGAVLVSLLIAIPVGACAGYFGGATDAVVSRLTETVMAFPLLLFLVFATAKLSPSLRGVAYSWVLPSGVFCEALLIGIFTSFYPTRLVRAQLLTLRSAEFVEAGHMIGASDWRILRRHLLPHLAPTLLVWAPIAVATNILLEVGLSFIGVGVQPSTPTWGSLLATAWGTVYSPLALGHGQTAWQTIVPTAAILITVLSLNQISEGVRGAIEPWARR